jgi:hypothetical protein
MHRGWMRSDDFKPEPFTEREAFVWSIENAAFEAHTRWFNGRKIQVERGQLVTSIRHMAAEFCWTIKRVRGFMERMGRCQKWAHLGAHTHCIITVCNYEEYQSEIDIEGHTQGQAEGTVRAQSGHSEGTQDKKDKEGKEDKRKNPPSGERGTRLPDDFVMPTEWADWAKEQGLDEMVIAREGGKFIRYWTAKTGAGATKRDWLKTWQNWVTKAIEDSSRGRGRTTGNWDHAPAAQQEML